MMLKKIFGLLMSFAMVAACQTFSVTPTFVATQTDHPNLAPPFSATPQTVTSTFVATQTKHPSLTLPPSQTPTPTLIQYPTANAIQANSVAFIADNQLWVANVDGSGERKLADGVKDGLQYAYMKWSPDGKWIAYSADQALWIVSRDGAVIKKLYTIPKEADLRYAWAWFQYEWSPDSSKIAYRLPISRNAVLNWTPKLRPTPTDRPMNGGGPLYPPYRVGMIEIATGEVFSDLARFESYRDLFYLSWLPDSRSLLFIGSHSLDIFEISGRKIIKEINHQCLMGSHLSWSPDGHKFVFGELQDVLSSFETVCIANLTGGSIHFTKISGTSSFYTWDKTGNALYFVTRDVDPSGDKDVYIDERVMRYDVITQKAERVLSLKDKEMNRLAYGDSLMSLSPDKNKMLIWQINKTGNDYMLLNLPTIAVTKFTTQFFNPPTWAADSENLIYLMSDHLFYKFNPQTQEMTAFTGVHLHYGEWAVSPVATFP